MASSVAVKRLENVIECAICAGELTDARVLPCVHTFCLKCIDKWSQNKQAGSLVSCPICRKDFEIPEGGSADLPKNCFVEKLLEIKKLSNALSQENLHCDVCCDDEETSGKKVTKKAAVYCIDCCRNMCEQCCGHHQKFRLPGVHKLVELKNEMNMDEVVVNFPENKCKKHADKNLEIYCFDCKMAVCMMCYIKSHNSHKCSDIKEVAEDLEKQITSNVENLAEKVTEFQTVLENIEENEKDFCNSVAETEKLICERAEKLKQLIEGHKQSLLEQLSLSKDKQLKQTANVREEVERRQIIVENFIRYSNEVKQKGSACDITKLADELNARSQELQKFDIATDLSADYTVTDVNFTLPETDHMLEPFFGNLAISAQEYFKVSSQLVHTIRKSSGSVCGIVLLNDHLYVNYTSTNQISVYDTTTFEHQHNRYLTCYRCKKLSSSVCSCGRCTNPKPVRLYAMVGCGVNNCLYASDQHNNYISKTAVVHGNSFSCWSVGSRPEGLSVTSSHNLLVALSQANALHEYSTDGGLIRQISLQPAGISIPVHAVQLPNDQYAVTHHAPTNQFSIVNSEGQLVKNYSGNAGEMNQPREFVVDEQGRAFVADRLNDRILVVSMKTLSAYQLPLPDDCQLQDPFSIYYDSAKGRLYICEDNAGLIFCCTLTSRWNH